MQLRLSIICCAVLTASSAVAEDYLAIQYMHYDEDSGRTTISTPSIEFNKDFGADFTLNLTFAKDTLSGASPTFYDSFSGASATLPAGTVYANDIRYGNIEYEDEREAFGFTLTKRFESRDELTLGGNYSTENDYESKEASLEYMHYLDSSKNQALTFGASYQKNDVSVYCSLGTGDCDSSSGASEKVMDLDVTTLEIGFTQVIDKSSILKSSLFYIHEDGYLTNPYMHVVRDYATAPKITVESKPQSRKAYGLLFQYSKAWSDQLSMVSSYRFYRDDWDINSHTLSTELYYEVNDKLRVGGGIRYYTQSEAEFYSAKRDFFTNEKYASSDRRVSDFDTFGYKAMVDYKYNDQVTLNLGVGYYEQPDHLDAIYYNLGFKYNF